uniref:Kinesin motor domain-containing protein n=1 Tax=Emiliania huxleyi TaxID=2903 RepID=A0A7S3U386_EMIHU
MRSPAGCPPGDTASPHVHIHVASDRGEQPAGPSPLGTLLQVPAGECLLTGRRRGNSLYRCHSNSQGGRDSESAFIDGLCKTLVGPGGGRRCVLVHGQEASRRPLLGRLLPALRAEALSAAGDQRTDAAFATFDVLAAGIHDRHPLGTAPWPLRGGVHALESHLRWEGLWTDEHSLGQGFLERPGDQRVWRPPPAPSLATAMLVRQRATGQSAIVVEVHSRKGVAESQAALHHLGRMLAALARKESHVPARSCSLTRLLSAYLSDPPTIGGGRRLVPVSPTRRLAADARGSQVWLVVCVSALRANMAEAVAALGMAESAMGPDPPRRSPASSSVSSPRGQGSPRRAAPSPDSSPGFRRRDAESSSPERPRHARRSPATSPRGTARPVEPWRGGMDTQRSPSSSPERRRGERAASPGARRRLFEAPTPRQRSASRVVLEREAKKQRGCQRGFHGLIPAVLVALLSLLWLCHPWALGAVAGTRVEGPAQSREMKAADWRSPRRWSRKVWA